jgi:acyl carrier protein
VEQKVMTIIRDAVLQLNSFRKEGDVIEFSEDFVLFGPGAVIDSLDLVNVITEVEESISDEFDLALSLTDDRAMTREVSPYDSVSTLKEYVLELLSEKQ